LHAALFFFQAEDGIRDWSVTGVQTCALPIFWSRNTAKPPNVSSSRSPSSPSGVPPPSGDRFVQNTECRTWPETLKARFRSSMERSEERRVGKECGARWAADE